MIKKIILRILIALTILIIILLILLPGIIKRYSINNSKELIGRQIDMDKLKLNYFTGMIKITDFTMYETDEMEEFVSFDTLIINLEPFQFFASEFVMESFYLKGLKTKAIQHDSVFNFDDLIAFHTSIEDTTARDTTNTEPFHFQLSNIELNDAEFIFEDQNINKTTAIRDLSFFVPYIGWNQDEKSEAGLRFALKNEGYFESSINVDPIEGEYEAEITIYHLYLVAFQEYAASFANIDTFDGLFNSQLMITGNINEAEKSLVSGHAEILDFVMKDQQNKKFLGAKKLDCILKEVDLDHMSFILDSLILTEPYVYFELDTNTNNFFEIFNITPEPADSGQNAEITRDTTLTSSSDSMYFAINSIVIDHGVVEYRDNLTGEPFEYYLSDIMLDADSIESTSEWIDLYAGMLLNKRGTLKAEVGFNPANPMDMKLNYVITDFQLSDLNIYSRFYMGFPIVYGDMYYKSETEIMHGQLSSENKLIINNVEMGDKSGGLYDLPMKFALFLLKDRDGVINLDVPVHGNLNDPTVRVGKIVWNTFKNLIVKVAAAPFDLLAGLLSVDPKDIQAIEYEYCDTTLTEKRKNQLDLLLELEQKKDGLHIELVYFNDVEKEKAIIALKEVGKQFFAKSGIDYHEDNEKFEEYVISRIESDSLDLNKACMTLADQATVDSLALMFEHVREANINKYLQSFNNSTQIITRISNPNAPKNIGSFPVFEVKYSMKSEQAEQQIEN